MKMEENWNKLSDNDTFVTFLFPGEARDARIRALREYIEQLERRIEATDASRHPRYLNRLKNELNMTKSELDSVTESS